MGGGATGVEAGKGIGPPCGSGSLWTTTGTESRQSAAESATTTTESAAATVVLEGKNICLIRAHCDYNFYGDCLGRGGEVAAVAPPRGRAFAREVRVLSSETR